MRMPMCMLEQIVGDSQALDRALAGEELSYKEIAQKTSLPINTVKVTLLRAKKVLAEKINEK